MSTNQHGCYQETYGEYVERKARMADDCLGMAGEAIKSENWLYAREQLVATANHLSDAAWAADMMLLLSEIKPKQEGKPNGKSGTASVG